MTPKEEHEKNVGDAVDCMLTATEHAEHGEYRKAYNQMIIAYSSLCYAIKAMQDGMGYFPEDK